VHKRIQKWCNALSTSTRLICGRCAQALEEGGNEWCKYGVAQMQGWRMTMVR